MVDRFFEPEAAEVRGGRVDREDQQRRLIADVGEALDAGLAETVMVARGAVLQNNLVDRSLVVKQSMFEGPETYGELTARARKMLLQEVVALLTLIFGGTTPPFGTVFLDLGHGAGKLPFDTVKAYPFLLGLGVERDAFKHDKAIGALEACVRNKTMTAEEATRVKLVGPVCAATSPEGNAAVMDAVAIFAYDRAFKHEDYVALAALYSEAFKKGKLRLLVTCLSERDWESFGLKGATWVRKKEGFGVDGGNRTFQFFVADADAGTRVPVDVVVKKKPTAEQRKKRKKPDEEEEYRP